jgi:5-methylcytosine-specific restriction endonuclease McrA
MSQSAVLFLDAQWRPLRVEPWTRAFADLMLGKVEVIEYSKDRTIQGVSRTYPLPSVVRVLRNFKRTKIRIKFSRINIYTRDKFTCQYCGDQKMTENLNLDHVLPRAQSGKTTWENVVTSCVKCNTNKANRTPEQAGLKLLSQPKKPLYLPAITVRNMNSRSIPEEWRGYWVNALDT